MSPRAKDLRRARARGRDLPTFDDAKRFLELLGPLDERGWTQLAHAPVEMWPAAEIIDEICETIPAGLVPIDTVGMLTERV